MRRSPALALVILLAAAVPAMAGIIVSGPFIDDSTGGDWRGTYGECFYMVPDTRLDQRKDAAGPELCSQAPQKYRYNSCYGGPIFNVDPGQSSIDWRIFRAVENDSRVISWHTRSFRDGSSQWNPCLNDFRHATWSNDTLHFDPPWLPKDSAASTVEGEVDEIIVADPLTIELVMNVKGAMTLTYYFTNADNVCRDIDFRLLIDGVEASSGTVSDIAGGKYVSFDIDGLKATPQGTVFTLESSGSAGEPSCVHPEGEEMVPGTNTHVSGVFVDFFNTSDSCKKLIGGILGE